MAAAILAACGERTDEMMENSVIKQGRIAWIDALRGFAMWLVVIMHVQFFSGSQSTVYNTLIAWMFMPLFFFVSGLVMYNPNRQWTAHSVVTYLWKKVQQILVPTVVVFLLAIWILGYNLVEASLHPMKFGYWFTITLFGFIALYVLFEWLMQVCKVGNRGWLVCLVVLTVVFSLLLSRHGLYTRMFGDGAMVWFDALQIDKWSYFQFFVLGILVRKYKDVFLRLLSNKYAMGIVIVAYVLMAVVNVKGLPSGGIQRYLAAVCVRLLPYASICIVTALFCSMRQFWSDSRTGKALQVVGSNTLGIYLIHYFFLAGNWSFLRTISTNTPPALLLIVFALLAVAIIACCMVVIRVIRLSPFLAKYMIGDKEKRV